MVGAYRGSLESFDRLVDHVAYACTFVVCHGCCGTGLEGDQLICAEGEREEYLVEEDGTVDYVEVVGGWHVAQRLGVNEVVECGEEGFRCVEGFVYEACVWG